MIVRAWHGDCIDSGMKLNCPNPSCIIRPITSLKIKQIVRNGSIYRRSDSRWIQRYRCRQCGIYFSKATFDARYYQKNRRINSRLNALLCSGVSQRRAARLLGVNQKSVVRRFRFLAEQARVKNELVLRLYYQRKAQEVQFDDLETSEHTKCKPMSVSLAVDAKSRKILGFQASRMPAKGLLSRIARKKYGPRPDDRPVGWLKLMYGLKPYVQEGALFSSDEHPRYPQFLKHHFPRAKHKQVKGKRGAITGQGELKKVQFDPLFSLNHTCAMLRANLNRLFRRTWCTTKTRQGLIDHLSLYVLYHNTVLTQ